MLSPELSAGSAPDEKMRAQDVFSVFCAYRWLKELNASGTIEGQTSPVSDQRIEELVDIIRIQVELWGGVDALLDNLRITDPDSVSVSINLGEHMRKLLPEE